MSQRAILSAASLFPNAGDALSLHFTNCTPDGRSAQLRRMDRLCGLALCVADRALLDARAVGRFDPQTTAIVVGSAYGCHQSDEEFFRGILAGQPGPRLFAYTLPSSPVGEVSIHHGLLGPGLSVVTGRTAGIEALCQADELLRGGHARACLVIACEVAAPAVPEQPEDASLVDGAVAILLGPSTGGAEFGGGATAFVPDDPSSAIAASVAQLLARKNLSRAPRLVCDPQTRKFVADSVGEVRVLDSPSCGAAAALKIFADLSSLSENDCDACVVVAADPCGLAAAALWLRA